MNKVNKNMASLAFQRETHFTKRQSGMASTEMLVAAEEKAASCEMEEISCQLPENTRSTFLVAFSPNGTKVASAHGNHRIYVSDVRTGKCLHTLEGHPRTPWCLTFHPSYNDVLASGCLGGEVRVWDLDGGCEIWTGTANSAIASLAFHPTDHVLVIATTNMVYFWNWTQAQPFAWCKTATEKERVRFVRFDPYGHRLFTGIANVSAMQRLRDDLQPTRTRDRDQEERSLHDRFFVLNEQYRQLLQRFQELHSQPSNTGDETLAASVDAATVDQMDQPPSPTVADALRLAREYAADMATSNTSVPQIDSNLNSSERNFNLNAHPESSAQSNFGQHNEPHVPVNEGWSRLSFQELVENVRSMRLRYTRICERLRELLMLRSISSGDFVNNIASDVNLVHSLLTFWSDYETFAICLQNSTLSSGTSEEPNRDARVHIAGAMASLFQLQDLLRTNILHEMNETSERGMARLIRRILMTLLELATLDTNMLALRAAIIGHTVHAQWASSIHRPEARHQSSINTTSSRTPSTATSSRPSSSRLNPRSWYSASDSTTYQIPTFRSLLSTTPQDEESSFESTLSNPQRASSLGHLSNDIPRRNVLNSNQRSESLGHEGLATGVSNGSLNTGETESTSSSSTRTNSRGAMHHEPSLNISNAEQLLHFILDELLSFLGSANSNNMTSTRDNLLSSVPIGNASTMSPSSPNFPASWYPYWWNHLRNIRSTAGLYSGLSDPVLITRATYRIQCWDFTKFQIPDISNSQVNIIVPECLIQNDANIEISADGRLLATLVPSSVQTSTLLAVHSLQPDTFSQCLYLWSFSSSVISISLSPLGRYVLVGLGSNRRSPASQNGKLIIGQVLQLVEGRDEKTEYLQHVRTVELRGENRFDVSLNSMRWLPLPGEGLVYGTNRGDLRICRPRSCIDPWVKSATQGSSFLPRRSYRDIVARVLMRRPCFLHHSSLTRLVFPATNTTSTQTGSDSD